MIQEILAVFGERYCNTDGACSLFPEVAEREVRYFPSIGEVFEAVDGGQASGGIVPRKNSNAGTVAETEKNLQKYPDLKISIVREKKIEHHLCGIKGSVLSVITHVLSHGQALSQCAEWLEKNLPVVIKEEVSSTAAAARMVSEAGDKTHAAIASHQAAEVYGLEILVENIQPAGNTTEFILICNR